ncbi:MAG: single-stranded DNA-binding protein [Eubacteriales bacterium]|jgi:single-strand DNA-binding protein|nr:single-stranded DNA-binding protein [Eubacteriales bacterium]
MNTVQLVGRLTRDPEVRYSQNNMAVARFSVAIDRPPRQDGTREADFPNVVVFGRQAENCERYLSKGRMVAIIGRLQTGSYVNKNGDKVYTTEVVANRVEFLPGGSNQSQGGGAYGGSGYGGGQGGGYGQQSGQAPHQQDAPQAGQSSQQPSQTSDIPQGFEAIEDDDIPF